MSHEATSAPTPGEVVREYFRRVRERDVGVADLFAPDAKLVGLGTVVQGRAAIADFYRDTIENAGPTPTLVEPLMTAGSRVAAEIHIELSGELCFHVVDLFEVDGGQISSLTYFLADH